MKSSIRSSSFVEMAARWETASVREVIDRFLDIPEEHRDGNWARLMVLLQDTTEGAADTDSIVGHIESLPLPRRLEAYLTDGHIMRGLAALSIHWHGEPDSNWVPSYHSRLIAIVRAAGAAADPEDSCCTLERQLQPVLIQLQHTRERALKDAACCINGLRTWLSSYNPPPSPPPPPPSPPPPQQLSLSWHEELGKGAFGVVWRVSDRPPPGEAVSPQFKDLYADYAAKVFFTSTAPGHQMTPTDLVNEHKRMQDLYAGYPRRFVAVSRFKEDVVPVAVDPTSPSVRRPIIIMEYCAGGSLADLLPSEAKTSLDPVPGPLPRPDPLPFCQILEVAKQLFEGLAWMHTQIPPIRHMDLHPGNICLAKPLTAGVDVRIVDVGLATSEFGVRSRATGGVPKLFSPRRIRLREIDEREDVWCAGCVILMLAAHSTYQDIPSFADVPTAVMAQMMAAACTPRQASDAASAARVLAALQQMLVTQPSSSTDVLKLLS